MTSSTTRAWPALRLEAWRDTCVLRVCGTGAGWLQGHRGSAGGCVLHYSKDLSEFILPYEAVRNASSPEKELTAFFESTYDPAARLASWDRADLERTQDTTK